MKKKHLLIVPRWSGTPSDDWYPTLSATLRQQNMVASLQVCDLPNPDAPEIAECTASLLNLLEPHKRHLRDVVLVGHSVGAQIVLHGLQKLDAPEPVDSVVLIAPWWRVDHPWAAIEPWMNATHDFDRIKSSASDISVLISKNDPFTADYLQNATQWTDRVSATVQIVPDGKHFNNATEPAVFDMIRTALTRNSK